MKIAYAFRRSIYYPYRGNSRGLPDRDVRARLFGKIREIGFEAVELGVDMVGGPDAAEGPVTDLRRELEDYGTPCVAVRGGGGVSQPNAAAHNRLMLDKTVDVASWLGAGIVNITTSTPPRNPDMVGAFVGDPVSQGGSRMASSDDFERTAAALREVGSRAGNLGIDVTIEVHQQSITDNSWSTLHMLNLIDSPHVFANPDLGNVYWCYDIPEESTEDAIVALAPKVEVLALQEPAARPHPGERALHLHPRPPARRRDRLPVRHLGHARCGFRRLPGGRGDDAGGPDHERPPLPGVRQTAPPRGRGLTHMVPDVHEGASGRRALSSCLPIATPECQ